MARPRWWLMAGLLLAGLLLALRATPGAPPPPFKVMVEGNSSEVGYGGTVLLNCSSNCPEPNPLGGLETFLSKEVVSRGPGWLSVRLRNITAPVSEILCYFSCFGRRETATFTVLAYDFHPPQVSLSTTIAVCNKLVTVSCIPGPSWPPGQKLQLLSSSWPPQHWSDGPKHMELLVQEKDDGAEFTCQAQLSVGNQTMLKSSTATLRVLYAPRMDDESCPPSQNWTEGQDETLRCWARGNPPPILECAKDREPFTAGVLYPVTRAHTGTYHCRATNTLGTAERDIIVWVHYHDSNWLLPVLVSLVLLVVMLVVAGVSYRVHYRQKKVRRYQLQQERRRRQLEVEMETLHPGGRPGTAALNGAAPAAQQ